VCNTLSLFADRHDEDFHPYFTQMVGAVWHLLSRISRQQGAGISVPRFDSLVARAIRFLSSAARRPMYRPVFEAETTLRSIVETIVLPNLVLTPDDEDVFESQPEEFLARDVEGSDADSRRRSAAELVKGLSEQFEKEVGAIVLAHVTNMVGQWNKDKVGSWKHLEAAIPLITAISVRAQTRMRGVTILNSVVDPIHFFVSCVIPILRDGASTPDALNTQPMLKAAALKFVKTFRNQFGAEQLAALFTMVTPYLDAKSEVVTTYAAIALEAIVTVRGAPVTAETSKARTAAVDAAALAASGISAGTIESIATATSILDGPQTLGPARLSRAAIAPHLVGCLPKLIALPERLLDAAAAGSTAARRDNPFHLQAAARILSTCREVAGPAAGPALSAIARVLEKVCKDPCRPRMHHWLFECVCAAARAAVAANGPTAADAVEAGLGASFNAILSTPIQDLLGYLFQSLALITRIGAADGAKAAQGILVGTAAGVSPEAIARPLGPTTQHLLKMVLGKAAWADPGVVPALVAFIVACIQRDPAHIVSAGYVNVCCERVVEACYRASTEADGFKLYRALVTYIPGSAVGPTFAPAIGAFVARLMAVASRGGVRVLRNLLPTLATVAGVHGGEALFGAMETSLAASGSALSFLKGVVGPQMNKVVGRTPRRTCLVGWGRFLTDTARRVASDPECLKILITGLAQLLAVEQDDTVNPEEAAAAAEAEAEFKDDTESRFTRLSNAALVLDRTDGLPAADPIGSVATAIASVSTGAPGVLPPVLAALDPQVAVIIKRVLDERKLPVA
jgi:exportin-2 (importin alpha re-exporter)